MSIRVFKYGCLPPSRDDLALMADQSNRALDYQNRLCEVARNNIDGIRGAYLKDPQVAALEQEREELLRSLEETRATINEHKAQAHLTDTPLDVKDLQDKTTALKADLKANGASLKAARAPISKALRYHAAELKVSQREAELSDRETKLSEAIAADAKKSSKTSARKLQTATKAVQNAQENLQKARENWEKVGGTKPSKLHLRIASEVQAVEDQLDRDWKDIYNDRDGVYWGTAAVYSDAVKSSLDNAKKKGSAIRFPRPKGIHLRVQIQKQNGVDPLPVRKVFRANNHVWIDPVPDSAWVDNTRKSRKARRTLLHFRANSNEDGSPVWVTLNMDYHRMMPEHGVIKEVRLVGKRVATKMKWHVLFSVDFDTPTLKLHNQKVCALNLGWRMTERDGLRVATVSDRDGNEGLVFTLDPVVIERIKQVDRLRGKSNGIVTRGIQSLNFDEARTILKAWLTGSSLPEYPEWLREYPSHKRGKHWRHQAETVLQAGVFPEPPEWLRTWRVGEKRGSIEHLAHWRSPRSLNDIIIYWRDNRFKGDEALFGLFEGWRKKDKHLWLWAANQRQKALNRRQDQYRRLASQLVAAYDHIVLPNVDWASLVRRKPPEDDLHPNETADFHRFLAAPAELEKTIINAATRAGKKVYLAPSENITQKCSSCGHSLGDDLSNRLTWTCPGCHTGWDQDDNATRNCLDWFEAASPSEKEDASKEAFSPSASRYSARHFD